MKSYARLLDNIYVENIAAAVYDDESPEWVDGDPSRVGQEIDINLRFTAEFVNTLVEITNNSVEVGMEYKDGVFKWPDPITRTPEERLLANTVKRDALLTTAALAIAPLQDAVDLEDVTASEVDLLKKWKQYRVALNRTQLSIENPVWPTPPV